MEKIFVESGSKQTNNVFYPFINRIRREMRLFKSYIKAIVTLTVRHPYRQDNASHVLFSSLCPLKFGWKADYIGHRTVGQLGFPFELNKRHRAYSSPTGNDIEKRSQFSDPPTEWSDKSDQKVDNIVGVYNRILPDLTRQYISADFSTECIVKVLLTSFRWNF